MSPLIAYAENLVTHPALPDIFLYAWLEGIMKAKLDFLKNVPDWHELTEWPAGRIFCDIGEYRWHLRGHNQLHTVIILDDENQLPDAVNWQGKLRMESEKEDIEEMILWGDWIDPARDPESNPDGEPCFFANEVPVVHHYPFTLTPAQLNKASEQGKTPRLVIRRYRHHEKGEFVRCVGLTMKEGVQL
ncbi:MAG: hypothetical protein KKC76_14080 [Proteobacteria bacterium]|nr:hypothetical protein [Pseudomonadota bacterium]MBU4298310.1 hypothetical protein [Pseudomonadota bacterium]MCG2749696.1 hypothetical protein [Desulfobulbaceae bacterium]